MKIALALALAVFATGALAKSLPAPELSAPLPTLTDGRLLDYVYRLDGLCRGGGAYVDPDAACEARDFVYDELVIRGYCLDADYEFVKGKSEEGGNCVGQ
jgi:hypothetical protein